MKCPICKITVAANTTKENSSNQKDILAQHIEKIHWMQIPDNMDVYQYMYFLKYGRETSNCIVCKKPTTWNPKTQKPHRLCGDPKCREALREKAVTNNFNKFGDNHPINDINHQIKMQKSKKSARPFKFSDGEEIITLSKDEYNFLQYCVTFLEMTSSDIVECPYTFEYFDGDVKRQYAPDLYLIDYNLIIEIKDDGNTNPDFIKETRYKVKLKAEAVEKDNRFNYIIVYGKNYTSFLKMLFTLRTNYSEIKNHKHAMVVHNESVLTTPMISNNLYDLYLGVVRINSSYINLFLADDVDLTRLYIGDANGSLAPTSIYNDYFKGKDVSLYKLDSTKWDKLKSIYSVLQGQLIPLSETSPDQFILELLSSNSINFYLNNIINNNELGLNDFTLVKSGSSKSFKIEPVEIINSK